MRTLILSLVLLAVTNPGFAQATGPDGFGPIKFGMTKAEAWEAIAGEGEWIEEDSLLKYNLRLSESQLGFGGFTVSHYFRNNVAAELRVQVELADRVMPEACLNPFTGSLSLISYKYGVEPVHTVFSSVDSFSQVTQMNYEFSFDLYSSILAVLYMHYYPDSDNSYECIIEFYYYPPYTYYTDKDPRIELPF